MVFSTTGRQQFVSAKLWGENMSRDYSMWEVRASLPKDKLCQLDVG